MTPADIRTKMEELKTYIQDADIAVRGGKMVDLGGLDKRVSQICLQATSQPKAKALEIQPLMAELIGELERLTLSLKDYRDGLSR